MLCLRFLYVEDASVIQGVCAIRGEGKLYFFAIVRNLVVMGSVFLCDRHDMLEPVKHCFSVNRHGEVRDMLFAVSSDGDATEKVGAPVRGHFRIVVAECWKNVVSIALVFVSDE